MDVTLSDVRGYRNEQADLFAYNRSLIAVKRIKEILKHFSLLPFIVIIINVEVKKYSFLPLPIVPPNTAI